MTKPRFSGRLTSGWSRTTQLMRDSLGGTTSPHARRFVAPAMAAILACQQSHTDRALVQVASASLADARAMCRLPQNRPSVPGVVPSGANMNFAWWLTVQFTPVADTVFAMPVSAIDSGWSKATVLTKATMPKDSTLDLASLADTAFGFCLAGDFNKDGRPDLAAVGVYEAHNKERGRFLLLLTQSGPGSWKKVYLSDPPGSPGFSLLWVTETGTLGLADCMECDNWLEIAWADTGYVVKSHPGGGE